MNAELISPMLPLACQSYLESFVNYERTSFTPGLHHQIKLERMQQFLAAIGDPQKSLKIIHLAGTKGKGSTCVFTAGILQQAGYHVGLYTSPHLQDYKERIRILNPLPLIDNPTLDPFSDLISDEEVARLLDDLKPSLEHYRYHPTLGRLSYFEVLTALAFKYFADQRVDWVVLETGLGGRLDATNAADGLVCGITPISLEHTDLLGTSIQQIAQEKAAIIKETTKVTVMGRLEPQAKQVIYDRCRKFRVLLCDVDQDYVMELLNFDKGRMVFHVRGKTDAYLNLRSSLLGRHQLGNAAMAIGLIEALQTLGVRIDSRAVREGIAEAFWPGRFEILRTDPTLVLDCAHNPASVVALVKTMQDIYPQRKIILILGISKDKDREGMCGNLKELADDIILTKANHPRAYCFDDLEERVQLFGGKRLKKTSSTLEALEQAMSVAKREDVILVTGSIFIVAEIRDMILKQGH